MVEIEPVLFKAVITEYQLSSDIVKTLPIYYFMLLEYIWEFSKLLITQDSKKLSLKENWKSLKDLC